LPENRQFSVGVSFQPLCLLGDHPAISAFVYLFFIIFYCIRNFLLLLLYPHHNEPHWPTAQSIAGGLDHFIDQEVPLVLQLNLTNLLGFTVEYINRQQVSDFRFPLSIILPNELLIGARTRCKDLWRKLSEHSALLEIRE
jgi:hypothetical protein